MARRSHLIAPALAAAALGMSGCLPVVQNQTSSQQDLIGPVVASAELCDTPQGFIPVRSARDLGSGDALRSLRRASRGVLPPIFNFAQACADAEDVEAGIRNGDVDDAPHQAMLGYRVPAGATAPATFTVEMDIARQGERIIDETRGGYTYDVVKELDKDVVFRRLDTLGADAAAGADSLRPEGTPEITGEGQKVVGYVSDVIDGIALGRYTPAPAFGLPGGSADKPSAGTFNSLTMSGTRLAFDTPEQFQRYFGTGLPDVDLFAALHSSREVECLSEQRILDILELAENESEEEAILELFQTAICPIPSVDYEEERLRDAEEPDPYAEAYTAALKGVDVNIRDLRVLGGEGFAEQGSTAGVPFVLRGAGAKSATQLGLAASSTLAGATATPGDAATPFPGAGDHARTVNVQVPADAAPGTYNVTLTAKVGGQTRTGTGRVVVLPKPAAAASQGRVPGRDNLYMGRDGTVSFGWICPPACGNNVVDITAPKAGISPKANTAQVGKPRLLRIARGKFKAATGKRARVKVKLFPKARRAILRGRKVKAILVVRTGGKGAPSVRRVTIQQRKPKR